MEFLPAPDLSGRVRELFRSSFGSDPALVGRAPGRVNLIGEHTDYNDGLCLPIALSHATYAAVAPRSDARLRLVSAQEAEAWEGLAEEARDGWWAYAGGLVSALRASGVPVPGLDIAIDSCVPVGAGLSSSAALECAVGVAVAELVGTVEPRTLVLASMRAEREAAGAPTGGMDQTVALHAEAGHALLIDFMTMRRTPVPWSPDGHYLLVIDTGVRHAIADGRYAQRRAECAEAAYELRVSSLREATLEMLPRGLGRTRPWVARARHVITENERVGVFAAAARYGDWSGIGGLLTASHLSLRDDFEVSCPELDVAVEAARGMGAHGARMTGGGFGGCAIALVPEDFVSAVGTAVDAAFRQHGWAAPTYLLAEASGPAMLVPDPA